MRSGRGDHSILRNTSIASRTDVMRRNWLTQGERQYVQTLLDEAIQHVKMRDMKACAAYVQHAIQSRRMSTSTLSPIVIFKFEKDGFRLLQQMLNRHGGYKTTMSITGEGTVQRSGRGRFGTADNDRTGRRSDLEGGVQHGGGTAEDEDAGRNRQTEQPCVDGKNKKETMCASHQSTSDRDWGSGHHTRVERVSVFH